MKATAPKIMFQDKPPAAVAWGVHPSPAGKLVIGITPARAICRVSFAPDGKTASVLKQWQKEWPQTVFIKAERETGYIAKKISKAASKSAGLPTLLMTGTPFQQKVWKGLLTIPAGETVSYGALARRIKNPKAARAVGSACGKNPVPLLVPCHRVIANDGGLGGFTGGLAIKKKLLRAETPPTKRKQANASRIRRRNSASRPA
jgi:O-6-methylguanine DNA methyltransferase